IEVTFDIDANGILNVTARDKATGKEQKITITATTNLSEDEIQRIIEEAKKHEAEDRRRRELAEARNLADTLVYQTRKALKDLGDKVPADERERIEAKVKELEEAMKGDDLAQIKSLNEEVQNLLHVLSQQLYAQGAAAGGTAGPSAAGGPTTASSSEGQSEGGSDEDVVEGEFREA
ncbi:MAG: Hsp70 family protein, partial [Chloroflexi bacterium]|nr:Hsp70 family protein [Chloroflexota bacterium]